MKVFAALLFSTMLSFAVMSTVLAQSPTREPTDRPEPTKSMPSNPPATGRAMFN